MLKYSEPKRFGTKESNYYEREVHCVDCGAYIGMQVSLNPDCGFKYEYSIMKLYNYCPYCGTKMI